MTPRRPTSTASEEVVGKAYDHQLAKRLLQHLRPHRWAAGLAVLLLLCNSLLQLAGPWITKIAIDDHIAQRDLQGLGQLAWLYLLVVVGGFTMQYGQFYLMQSVGQKIMLELRLRLLRHTQRQELAFFDRNPVGTLMTRITGDVQTLHELFTSGLVAIFGDLLTLIGIVIAMMLLDWRLAIVANIVLPILIVLSAGFRSRVRATYRTTRARVAAINAYLQEHITGMRVVQLFGREKTSAAEYDEKNRAHRDVLLKTISYYAVFFPAIELVSACATAMIIYYGGQRILPNGWMAGTSPLELGVLVAFLQYAERFFRPISDLSEKYNTFQAAMASSERIFHLLDRVPEIRSGVAATTLVRARGDVVFENVSFSYNPKEPVLRHLSFEIQAGERMALVGATGAGKTSILSILTRLYEIQQGRILLDGHDIRSLQLEDLRRQVGVVLQDAFLFAGSLEHNIRLGRGDIDAAQVREAARLVHADEFIQKLDGGYNYEVHERGSGLSLGQRQLISLARVMAFDPAILVLDEATSSIDTETEVKIQDALHRVMEGRTCLVVAHRLSTIQDCDRILVMHKGELRESGTHAELLRLKGIYARLYDLQFREQAA